MSEFDEISHEDDFSRAGDPTAALGRCAREIVEFVDAAGWGQAPQMFALVRTDLLADSEPELVSALADSGDLTPVEQAPFTTDFAGGGPELDEILGRTTWPQEVSGCALIQEIVVLPPEAERDLDDALAPLLGDPSAADAAARDAAQSHPGRRPARLIAAALRTGETLSLLQLQPTEGADHEGDIELLAHADLAPNLLAALLGTFDNVEDDF